jgi:hypothetical protein
METALGTAMDERPGPLPVGLFNYDDYVAERRRIKNT